MRLCRTGLESYPTPKPRSIIIMDWGRNHVAVPHDSFMQREIYTCTYMLAAFTRLQLRNQSLSKITIPLPPGGTSRTSTSIHRHARATRLQGWRKTSRSAFPSPRHCIHLNSQLGNKRLDVSAQQRKGHYTRAPYSQNFHQLRHQSPVLTQDIKFIPVFPFPDAVYCHK